MWITGKCAAASLTGALLVAGTALPPRAAAAAPPVKAAGRAAVDGKVQGPLTASEFDRLHARLTRMSTEKVWSVPWQLSVREARERAARDSKPVFLWISNNGGTHPLGPC